MEDDEALSSDESHGSAWGDASHFGLASVPSPSETLAYPREPRQVLEVKEVLLRRLPIELVDLIIDEAEYWPYSVLECSHPARSFGGSAQGEVVLVVRGALGHCLSTTTQSAYQPHPC